ncbi:hypothetical protein [Bacillus sp. CGMCC 1.16541]|uniref:hypothetical protein n=1 Tax=Bacillus sp. CGMCC 1.16541 TaxID=2185143 RepID=UPI000D733A7B|nr:hypothetical protein [Bacillus sp. CGMCC 1.16541]
MNNNDSFVEQQLLSGEVKGHIPYQYNALENSILHGQLIGGKAEAVVSKSAFSHEKSPLKGDFIAGQAEAKANIENYTASLGAEATAAKIELKLEPLNFFGYEPLEEWFGFEYDPYVGLDIMLGTVGVGASIGMETGAKVGAGIGLGGKVGLEKDEE